MILKKGLAGTIGVVSLTVILGSAGSFAAQGTADGIDIEGGKGWRIEEQMDGTWAWEGGGAKGTANSRDEAVKAAKKAKRAAKKDARKNK